VKHIEAGVVVAAIAVVIVTTLYALGLLITESDPGVITMIGLLAIALAVGAAIIDWITEKR
jgi:hypothetical protein